jgi:hypothetical protein
VIFHSYVNVCQRVFHAESTTKGEPLQETGDLVT